MSHHILHVGLPVVFTLHRKLSYIYLDFLLQRRLLYHLPRTTRGSRPLNINHPHSDSSSHHSSYLGLTDHPHLQLIYTHTYKPHTHTDSLRSLDLPRLSFLNVIPVFDFCILDLGPFPVILIVFCLPRPRIVSPELCLLAACPDPPPGTRPCLCLTPAVLPCRYLTLYCLTILIKSCKWIQTLLTHHYRRLCLTAIQRLSRSYPHSLLQRLDSSPCTNTN